MPALSVSIGLVLVLTACGTSATPSDSGASPSGDCAKMDDITYGMSRIAQYAAPQVMISQGVAAKYCINLVPVEVASASVSMAQVQAGRQDLALLNGTSMVSAVASGIKIKAIAPATVANADNPLYIKKDGPITSPKDLEGRKVHTTSLGSSTDIANRVALSNRGVDVSKIEFVHIPSGPSTAQALLSDQTAAGQVNEPYATENIDKLTVLIESPAEEVYGAHASSSFFIAREDWVNSNADLVTRFQKAYVETAQMVQQNPQIFRDAIREMLDLPPDVLQKMRVTTMVTEYNIDSTIKQVEYAVEFGGIPQGLPEDQIRAIFVPLPSLD